MEILDEFGFDPILFAAQIVNFLILFVLFKKFLYKPLLGTLKAREDKIVKGLNDAEKAAMELEKAEEEREKVLSTTSREAQQILDDTKKTAENLKSTILDESRLEADKIITNAREQASAEMANVRKEAKGISLIMSKKILTSVVTQLFDKDEKEKIVQRGMKQIDTHE